MVRVKRFKHTKYWVSDEGHIFRELKGHMVSGRKNRPGYIAHVLTIAGKQVSFYAHKMVAELFVPNPENKPEVNHEDRDKLNNKAKNLEWMTSQENAQHAFKTGHSGQGETHYNAKLSNEDVRRIRELAGTGVSYSELARIYQVRSNTISRIVKWQRRKRG